MVKTCTLTGEANAHCIQTYIDDELEKTTRKPAHDVKDANYLRHANCQQHTTLENKLKAAYLRPLLSNMAVQQELDAQVMTICIAIIDHVDQGSD